MSKSTNKIKIDKIKKALKETFNNEKIPRNILNLKIGALKEWDSLGNFNFLLAIEDEFSVKFKMSEISSFKSVKEILQYLEKKSK
jgi:acyl carrier protein